MLHYQAGYARNLSPVLDFSRATGQPDPFGSVTSRPCSFPQVRLFHLFLYGFPLAFFAVQFCFCGLRLQAGNSPEEASLMNTIWGLVEPTDSGILEELWRRSLRDGEKRLMLALLESAVEDFQKYILVHGKRSQELFQQAEEWFLERNSASFFSFESVCDHLQLDPDYIRRGLMRWKATRCEHQSRRCSTRLPKRA